MTKRDITTRLLQVAHDLNAAITLLKQANQQALDESNVPLAKTIAAALGHCLNAEGAMHDPPALNTQWDVQE